LLLYRLIDLSLEFLIAYLKDRQQITRIVDQCSSFVDWLIDLLQCSVLSPFLFLIYINDLVYYVAMHSSFFAYDITLSISGNNLSRTFVDFS